MNTMRSKSQPTNLRNKFINIFVEQVSHHPPVSNFQLEHCNKDYQIYGHFEEDFKRNGSNLEFRTIGKTIVDFSSQVRLINSLGVLIPTLLLQSTS